MRSMLGWVRWGVGALVVLGLGGWYLWTQMEDVADLRNQVTGYSFSRMLPKVIDEEGGDARVVDVIARDKDVYFAVLTDDGEVSERFYGNVCKKSTRGSECAYRDTHEEHEASAAERRQARARLDELDREAVDRVRDAAGTGKEVPIGLRGRRWVVGSSDPKVAAVTDLDGSNLHRARSARERALVESVVSDPGR
jgi:hypothetical protein